MSLLYYLCALPMINFLSSINLNVVIINYLGLRGILSVSSYMHNIPTHTTRRLDNILTTFGYV